MALLCATAMVACASGRGDDPLSGARSVTVHAGLDGISARVLEDYLAVQGAPTDYEPFQVESWRSLGLGTDSIPLLNDLDGEGNPYFPEGGLLVIRSQGPIARPTVRGPFGPRNDLWLDDSLFVPFMGRLHKAGGLAVPASRVVFLLDAVPRTLSCPPGMPCAAPPGTPPYPSRFPHDRVEWTALMREVGRYLAESGYDAPIIEHFGEPETFFIGRDRAIGSFEAMRDNAELYVLTQDALTGGPASALRDGPLPRARLAGPCHATFSHRLIGNPYPDTADWLSSLQDLRPGFQPSAMCWQGYFHRGREMYDEFGREQYGAGVTRLRVGVEYVRGLLRQHGLDDAVPHSLHGWNFTWNNPQVPEFAGFGGEPVPTARILSREAAHLASQVVDLVTAYAGVLEIRGHYFTWGFDAGAGCGLAVGTQSIVSIAHDELPGGDPDRADCVSPALDTSCPRATYRALEALRSLADGDIVPVDVADAAGTLRAIATRHRDGRVSVLLVDGDAEALGRVSIALDGLGAGRYAATLRSIERPSADLGAEACASWLDQSLDSIETDGPRAATLTIDREESGPILLVLAPR